MSTTGLVAQAYGAQRHDQLRLHFLRALGAAAVIGALILLVQTPLIAVSVRMLGASPEVAANAKLYCHIRIWSAPAALANYVILGYLLGRQRARTALALQTVINGVNVVVALWLVVRMHWGIAGIATGTMLADWSGCALGLLLAANALHPESSREQPIRWAELLDGPSLRRLLALNRDIFLRTISLVAAYAWFTRTGAREGDAVLAANALLMNMFFVAAYGLDGFANATEALVGAAVGAQRLSDYRSILRASSVAAFTVSAIVSLAYVAGGSHLIGLFTNQEPVRILASRFLPWVMALPVVSVWAFQLDGIFIGATRAEELRDSMLLSFAVFLALAIVLERAFGNHGLWCAFCSFMILRGVTLGLRLPRIESVFATPAPVS